MQRYQKAKVSLPGGCLIGTRPVNYHLNALKNLGMKYEIKKGYIHAHAKNGLKGNNIKFKKISVGATENLIIAACLVKGKTILKNCAIEPEIKDLQIFYKKQELLLNGLEKELSNLWGKKIKKYKLSSNGR